MLSNLSSSPLLFLLSYLHAFSLSVLLSPPHLYFPFTGSPEFHLIFNLRVLFPSLSPSSSHIFPSFLFSFFHVVLYSLPSVSPCLSSSSFIASFSIFILPLCSFSLSFSFSISPCLPSFYFMSPVLLSFCIIASFSTFFSFLSPFLSFFLLFPPFLQQYSLSSALHYHRLCHLFSFA